MKCPGQDSRYWNPSAVYEVACPECGQQVEFFKDETSRKCRHCGHRFVNPKMDFGCAAYCKFADQCIGELPPELLASRENLLKDRVAVEMKRYFKQDFKRIGHAMKVARYAEQMLMDEGGEPPIVLPAAYLHDIGIKEAERKFQSTAARYQEQEGPPIAREILTRLGAREELIGEVCDIIAHHHHPRDEETNNFKVLHDADLIVNLEEAQKEQPSDPEHLKKIIATKMFTASGRKIAEQVLLGGA
ncbi:MAG: phosphohydrolase [Syntrophobacteraceae bacterium CG2_30_61_12]|nr:MAG: phosphohydrolase [Syntrophobacteraceae bacterium CG2_30_61_12]